MRICLAVARAAGRILLVVSAAVVLVLSLAPTPALACTPPPGGLPEINAAERARASDLVLIGEVTAVDGDRATIDAGRFLKSEAADPLQISGYGPTSICLSPVAVGQEWIFYAVSDGAGGYRAYYASQFDAVAPVTPETIAEIELAVLQQQGRLLYMALLEAGANSPAFSVLFQATEEPYPLPPRPSPLPPRPEPSLTPTAPPTELPTTIVPTEEEQEPTAARTSPATATTTPSSVPTANTPATQYPAPDDPTSPTQPGPTSPPQQTATPSPTPAAHLPNTSGMSLPGLVALGLLSLLGLVTVVRRLR